ncbi:glycosyltransferase family 87 protein [Zavarzinia compransoris]|uniref:DUF2029 domain-containing protein n=1 Tax=Zavarzinia compransoris TaxID=1264899 RepID=A0A317DVQ1_9PROT|nr:glycosyltransferase family 87 protein [Zavarzinia compransoris]PWR18777.1 hypothetical protein DKG75_17485 [Zavarzinia compransoris]TDP48762.1 uncharacterized protein DUF2029 [Zavarzinia compransoris]
MAEDEAGALRRQLTWAARVFFPCVAVFILFDQWPFLGQDFSRGQVFGRDFYIFWTAGRLVAEGRLDIVYDVEAFHHAVRAALGPEAGMHLFAYPPPALLGLGLIGRLPYGLALALWTALSTFAFVAAVAAPRWRGQTVALAAVAVPTLINMAMGQTGLFCAALFIAGLRLVPRHPVLAGLCIGLLIVKPVIALPLPVVLLAGRQGRAIAAAAVTVVVLCVLPVLLWGPAVWTGFLAGAMPAQRDFLEWGVGLAQAMKPTVFMAFRDLGGGVAAAYMAQGLAAVLALALLVLHLRGRGWPRRPAPGDILVAALAGAFATPYLHVYDLATVSGALVLLLAAGGGLPARAVTLKVPAILWSLPIAGLLLGLAGMPVVPLLMLFALVVLAVKPLHGGNIDARTTGATRAP